ncbi:membrane protein [Gordonia neofelifaecis]|uniref:Putative integral membrane protein n=1 Tax=Gordonia neofelifaecis NRRL B-59395 TaxID=644548 RepID=F1YEE8_9ACTN|nr:membrane protein [Gordonia neofelifaecis]EGD56781.1 putative integral membrane protein [Gordonia neofelifaecis NRRL B-59395]
MNAPNAMSQAGTALRWTASKVPEVTIYFWIIKILATTVGETAADYLNMNLGLGLRGTTVVTVALLSLTFVAQFWVDRYIPALYWWTVLLVSVTGTLITDNLTDGIGVPLQVSTAVFAVALVLVFGAWYLVEGTLSIHSIRTRRREAFYWLAVLVTFALGTAAGDLIAEKLALGYWLSLLLFAGVIGVITALHHGFHRSAVAAFWAAYIVTRPLGASLGDLLTQPQDEGGFGLDSTMVNLVFLGVIVVLVGYLSWTKVDQIGARGGATAGVVPDIAR